MPYPTPFVRLIACSFAVALSLAGAKAAPAPVTLTEVDEVIPTYLSGPPDPNPMFYFGGASQGAQGRIYPYPLYNNLTNKKADKTYHIVYLENEYVKVGIVPEIGGKLFSAVDKTNDYDFVYHQHVIKPALIGLLGAWISGGIEWNIPHHHRASTFLPVQYRTEDNADGSKTVWVGELEVRQRMRWAVGYTLHPGSSILECSVRILNRTPMVNTMLAFANVAVNANENYQIIFPPSTQHVAFHFKKDFTTWPIATTRFNGADFTKGVDVSWYKNHIEANSMFAWNYQDDFFAGYDHGKEAGTMSVADHHIIPGKKFWTWGNGPYGRTWDHILTDNDGPYVELMVGAYSDNQPDYSWLQPFETRSFEMHWYPFRDIGGVKNANLDAAVNLDVADGVAKFGFCTTSAITDATVRVTASGQALFEQRTSIDPGHPFVGTVPVPAGVDEHDVRASLTAGGRELVAYSPVRFSPEPMPEAVTPPPPPSDINDDEELDLAGQRIDQFHDPLHDPEPYWEESLRRDPGDVQAHMGLGLIDLRCARFTSAEQHFRQALTRLTAKYTTPKDAEPYYYLGVALKGEGRTDEAYDAFYKAAWSQEWKAPAYFSLAEIASARGDFPAALDDIDNSLDANALNVRAYGLKAAVLRHLGRSMEAQQALAIAERKTDPLDVRLMAEEWFLARDAATAGPLFSTLNKFDATAQETAAEYADAGLYQDGLDLLKQAVAASGESPVSPMVYYYLGEFADKLGQTSDYRRIAAKLPPDYVFPFQSEAIPVLRDAISANRQDARALYYLGNLLFDWQRGEAIALWEQSAAIDPTFPIVWRNLAQAYAHTGSDTDRAKAIAYLEKAVALSDAYPTHFAELDQLYAADGRPADQRLALLEAHQDSVVKNDEALASLVRLKTFAGKAGEAIALLQGHTFNIWEGGTRFDTAGAWTDAHLVLGLQHFDAGSYREAISDFQAARHFPENLRADRVGNAGQAELSYWTGCAYEKLGDDARAREAWTLAASDSPATGRQGGFQQPLSDRGNQRYFQTLALQKLGQARGTDAIWQDLVKTGRTSLEAPNAKAPDLPPSQQISPRARAAMAHYVAGLGYAGQGDGSNAQAEFVAALAASPDDLGAKIALSRL
jgi:tetratricopeptide (TPR) repeat protein